MSQKKYVPPQFRTKQSNEKKDDLFWGDSGRKSVKEVTAVTAVTAKLNVASLDDFPAMVSKKAVVAVQVPVQVTQVAKPFVKQNFAELTKEWARKQKEDEAKAKEEAEKEAELARLKRLRDEEMEKEARLLVKVKTTLYVDSKKKPDSDDEKELDIGCHVSDVPSDEDHYISDDATYDEEEEEYDEERGDEGWNGRKHRDDLY